MFFFYVNILYGIGKRGIMFNYLKKDKANRIITPVKNKGQSILEEDRFNYPGYNAQKKEAEGMVNYLRKPFAKKSITSIITSVMGLIFIAIAFKMNMYLRGNPNLTVSALAASSLLCAVTALVYGGLSFLEKNMKYFLAYLGIIIGGVQFILWIVIIIIGRRG